MNHELSTAFTRMEKPIRGKEHNSNHVRAATSRKTCAVVSTSIHIPSITQYIHVPTSYVKDLQHASKHLLIITSHSTPPRPSTSKIRTGSAVL
jgi:hypothetical protein